MISDTWLGYKWNELCEELKEAGIAFSYKVTTPRGRVEALGDLRVVRFRVIAGSYEFILANEKFSALPKLTP